MPIVVVQVAYQAEMNCTHGQKVIVEAISGLLFLFHALIMRPLVDTFIYKLDLGFNTMYQSGSSIDQYSLPARRSANREQIFVDVYPKCIN